ncbi:MAG: DUF2254 domain-containing protein [Nitrospirales bacterium]
MKTRLINLWLNIRSSLGFIPTLMTTSSIALAFLSIYVDQSFGTAILLGDNPFYSIGPQGARTLLATVAGSIITVAGVAFSITIVALTLASSHFGPRLLKNFMRDAGNQIVLGTFIATFIYSLFVLGSIRQDFVPQFSILLGILFTLASMGVFIYFIHHVSVSIHAENVIAGVGRDLEQSINRLFPEKMGTNTFGQDHDFQDNVPPTLEQEGLAIRSDRSGYLQAIDSPGIMALATKHDLLLHFTHRPGEFVVAGAMIAKAWPPARVNDTIAIQIHDAFILGNHRTEEQDIEFAIHQLVEVALRALSPGINDPFTAMSCIDRLGASLSLLAQRHIPSSLRYDDNHTLRVVTHPVTLEGIFDAAFNQIRQHGCSTVAIGIRLLETLGVIVANTQNPPVLQAVRHHAKMVKEETLKNLSETSDRKEVEDRYEIILSHLPAHLD